MVRVVDANQGSDSYTARITVLMGRNDQKSAQQSMSSPIQNTNSITGPLCTWDTGLCTADSDLGNTACWVTTLGQASLGSGTKGTLTCTSSSSLRMFKAMFKALRRGGRSVTIRI